MRFLYFILVALFSSHNLKSADFEILVTGIDKLTTYEKISENHIFMTYENKLQFTTNTSMFGHGTCSGTLEIINGKNVDNILCVHVDSYGNKGYFKSMNTDKTKVIRNMIGERIGSSVASWKLLNGEGPYKELSGLVLKGAYYSIGKNKFDEMNWIFQGKSENIPDSIIDRVNNYTANNNKD